jgi:membrane protease YdiL (CAAX protease family)
LFFILPLLVVYEIGVVRLGGPEPEALRNGADSWLRLGLARVGMKQPCVAPVLLVLVLFLWLMSRWKDRPGDLIGVLCGMSVESVLFALGLWGISRGLGPLIDYLGLELSIATQELGLLVTYVGAGIYEEMLFRLLLFSGMVFLLRGVGVSGALSVAVAGLASALLFSAAHHLGPHGEELDGYTFLFRTLAGVYFAFVYLGRGFGIAVGAHACYDVIVGMPVTG